jgi:hypothetical protein
MPPTATQLLRRRDPPLGADAVDKVVDDLGWVLCLNI